MAQYELRMPAMGESITEAIITKWLKNVNDKISIDDPVVEVATDKVDSEIPSPVEGKLIKQLFKEGDTVEINKVIAIIETDDNEDENAKTEDSDSAAVEAEKIKSTATDDSNKANADSIPKNDKLEPEEPEEIKHTDKHGRFYSPLVRNIAREENISMEELENMPGTGLQNRITKNDILDYLQNRKTKVQADSPDLKTDTSKAEIQKPSVSIGKEDEIIEMDRMRKLIASHMVMSEATSVHISLFAEADVTNIVNWRNTHKDILLKRENEKLSFTPFFIEAIAKAIKEYPMINISVDGDKIIKRNNINIGMATALPNGNLIVPVIKNADNKSLLGLSREINDLAARARENQLKPDEIRGGTFTMTNIGTFDGLMGTPIINQPEVGIMAVGAIKKKVVVIETEQGDTIGIRHMLYLSLSCDHRVVDGALGGMFLKKVKDNLENFDTKQII
ncbi:MAG: dihydrolipoamide acetyltransferase family protein [Bacteroidota bacterium]